jgi:hypothetical protein
MHQLSKWQFIWIARHLVIGLLPKKYTFLTRYQMSVDPVEESILAWRTVEEIV